MEINGETRDGLNALIAQREPCFRTKLASTVRSMGLNAFETGCGSEVVEIFSNEEIHALVLDAELPDFGGLEAVRIIRTFSDVPPFLLLAREVTRSLRAQAMESQAVSILRSPVDLALFCEILETVLAQRYGDWAERGAD